MRLTPTQRRVCETLHAGGSLRGKEAWLRSGLDFISAFAALRELAGLQLVRSRPAEFRALWFELTARGRVELRGNRKRLAVGPERAVRFRGRCYAGREAARKEQAG